MDVFHPRAVDEGPAFPSPISIVVSKSTCYPFPEYYFGRLKKYTTITYMYTNVYFDFIILIVQGPYRDCRETESRFEEPQQQKLWILVVSKSASLLSKETLLSGRHLQIKKLNFPLQNQ